MASGLPSSTRSRPTLPRCNCRASPCSPLIENAIKHGICSLLGGATSPLREGNPEAITLASKTTPGPGSHPARDGLGMSLVDKRLKSAFGERYGIDVQWEPEQWTRVS